MSDTQDLIGLLRPRNNRQKCVLLSFFSKNSLALHVRSHDCTAFDLITKLELGSKNRTFVILTCKNKQTFRMSPKYGAFRRAFRLAPIFCVKEFRMINSSLHPDASCSELGCPLFLFVHFYTSIYFKTSDTNDPHKICVKIDFY